jgi:hypothetical protein
LSVNIKFICTSFRNRQNSEPLASFSEGADNYETGKADHEEDTLDNIYERREMTLVSVLFV